MHDDENRKRGHQDDFDTASSSKRAALGPNTGTTIASLTFSEPESFLFKLLCPQSITGLIIGKKGAIINQLNVSTGAKIRLSQNHEFYPGTTDRILLINGSKECISNALTELVTRIADSPEKKSSNSSSEVQSNRGPLGIYQIRILIPRIATAAIIGRKGAVIQRMGEVSSCKFQLGDESDPYNTRERILLIHSNTIQNLVVGAQTVMTELLADTKIRTYPIATANYASMNPSSNSNGNTHHHFSGGSSGSMPNSVPQFHSGGFKPQPNGGIPYPSTPAAGPPPLLPLMNPYPNPNPYGQPQGSYGMPSMPPTQYMQMPAYAPPPMQQPMTHMTMSYPMQAMPQPHVFSMMPQQQQFTMPPGGMMPTSAYGPPPVTNGYPTAPMHAQQQPDPASMMHHMPQQYPMPTQMMMPNGNNNMYSGNNHNNGGHGHGHVHGHGHGGHMKK